MTLARMNFEADYSFRLSVELFEGIYYYYYSGAGEKGNMVIEKIMTNSLMVLELKSAKSKISDGQTEKALVI